MAFEGGHMSESWTKATTALEERVLKLCKRRPLWRFLREHRELLFDDDIMSLLASMYRESGPGRPPENLREKAMAMVLQVAFDVPDHEVPTLTVVDQRWQVVLGCLGRAEPLFSQGAVYSFRMRAIANGLADRLLERTVDLAREGHGFSHKRLRAIVDSSPLLGAGRIEDTFNLIGHAIGELATAVAIEMDTNLGAVIEQAGVPLMGASSVKAWLDIDWSDKALRADALQRLLEQFQKLCTWLKATAKPEQLEGPPLGDAIELVKRLIEQDLEPDPDDPDGTRMRIRTGVTPGRQVSISDPSMRHGRKSKTKLFNGYKRHILVDADVSGLICATDVVGANVREHEPLGGLLSAVESVGFEIAEVHVDRGYIPSADLMARRDKGLTVLSKAPTPKNYGRFPKTSFAIDLDAGTVTCPADVTVPIRSGKAKFPVKSCRGCAQRTNCTSAKGGRSIAVHPNEEFHQEMRATAATRKGRQSTRERVAVEHALARVGQIQGRRARFRGLEKNKFDLKRTAIVSNCYVLARILTAA